MTGKFARRRRGSPKRQFLGTIVTEGSRLYIDDPLNPTLASRLVIDNVPDGEHKVWATRDDLGKIIRVTVELGE